MPSSPTLGFLGLGAMGGPMARNLLRAGYPLIAFDPVPDRLALCVEAGAVAAQGAPEVVAQADFILTSLRSSEAFVEVAERDLLPHARPGQVFIDLGTTAPPETRRLAAGFAARGATLIDSPVSGGPHGAETGTLRMFVGGDGTVTARVWPILWVLGDLQRVVYCGPSGSGQVVKGVNQLAMGLGAAAYLEAIRFGMQAGVDAGAIRQAVGGNEPWREYFASLCSAVIDGHAEGVWVKFPELPYFLSEAREQGLNLPLTEALYAYLSAVEPTFSDNMGRPTVSFWHELTTRTG